SGVDAALSGATVTAAPDGGGTAINLPETSTAGKYRADSLPPGDYTVTASKSGYANDTFDLNTVTAGTAITQVDLNLVRQQQFALTMQSKVTIGTDSQLSELTNATIVADATGTANDVTFTHTADGVYTAQLSAAVDYTVTATAPGHTSNLTLDTIDHTEVISGGADVSLGTFFLVATNGTITGNVKDVVAVNISGVAVKARNGSGLLTATTNASGNYTISGAAPGTWTVTFELDEYAPLTIVATVPRGAAIATGGSVTADVTMAPAGGAINGQTLS